MVIISAIEKTKKGRYALFVEGEFVFSVTAEQLYKDGIQAGTSFSEDELLAIKTESGRIFAKEYALNLLSNRSYTKKKLAEKLCKVTDENEVIEEVIDRMVELGLLDDELYARRMAAELYRVKKYGKRRVVQYLMERGIPRDLAQDAAAESEPEDSSDVLTTIVERKYARVLLAEGDRNAKFKAKAKVQNALVRRGYSYEEIRVAIDTFLENADE